MRSLNDRFLFFSGKRTLMRSLNDRFLFFSGKRALTRSLNDRFLFFYLEPDKLVKNNLLIA
jgi:hypothetical protein